MEIDYDPERVSYEELLTYFVSFHTIHQRPYDQRVKSLVLYRTEDEQEAAEKLLAQIGQEIDAPIFTEVKALETFYLAEQEHQYRAVQMEVSLLDELNEIFPSQEQMQLSILVSKLNGFLYGFGDREGLDLVLDQSGLSEQSKDRIRFVWEGQQ